METKWIIVAIVLICVIAFIVYLIVRNQKDKNEVIKYLNETEIENEPETKKKED
ncbi:MAG: FeoB-associated Cys-rich membrane protein [Paludibacter sp.]|nr:FeoB-associated Cys-rich membrane protein [Paludibacter sp.]